MCDECEVTIAISTSADLTCDICKWIISKQCITGWQTRWDRSNVGRTTYDLIPSVGRTLLFPDDRSSAVSYARLLLDNIMLKVHQQRCGFNSSRICECGHGIKDAHHSSWMFTVKSTVLKDQIRSVWDNSDNDGSATFSVLFPYNNERLTVHECHQILSAVFEYI